MEKFMDTCGQFFGEFNEMNVKNNFSLIYELLDEVLDYGYPQTTDPDALKILSEDSKDKKGAGAMDAGKISSQVTGQIGWRRQDISYVLVVVWAAPFSYTHVLHALASCCEPRPDCCESRPDVFICLFPHSP